jgi:hypothetical protein
MVCLLATQPLAHAFLGGAVLYDVLFTGVACLVFMVVFQHRRERLATLAAGLAVLASTWGVYGLSGTAEVACVVVYHGSVVAFLGFAVVVILRGIFRKQVIRSDDVIGVCCGYLLLGLAWANLYVLVEILSPGSFALKSVLQWQLANRHTRRFLFNYFSFITLTTVGYGDVTPAGPTAAWLACLEAVLGQFYLAVVVAQLVGLKLAGAVRKDDPA